MNNLYEAMGDLQGRPDNRSGEKTCASDILGQDGILDRQGS